MKMKDGSVAADVYMLLPHKDHEATPQSIFLHELGHCVNIALTGDPEVPPEDFTLVMKLIGAGKAECDVPEFFAHCFAMSLLIEPDLLNADLFKTVPQNHKRMFRAYLKFRSLIYSLKLCVCTLLGNGSISQHGQVRKSDPLHTINKGGRTYETNLACCALHIY